MAITRLKDNLEHLGAELEGRLLLEADPGWDRARAAWNLAVDQRPAAVALPATPDDVARVVRAASDLGMRVAAQATGHNARPLPALDDVILLKTERLRWASVDPAQRRARAGAGALWFDVSEPASTHGLVPLAGSSPDVGVAGYTLGGGLSWLGRKHGLAANSVTSIDVVGADGVGRRVDAHDEPDLFWALRGGGGNFGVVTALDFRIHPAPNVYAGWLVWPVDQAALVMRAWSSWLAGVPDDVTSILRLLRVPPSPAIPAALRGRDLVVVEAAMLLPEASGASLLSPLRELAPEIDTFARIPPLALSHLHMDPDQPVPAMGDSRMLRGLPDDAIDAIVSTVGPRTDSPLVTLELRHLGGELARPHPQGGAVTAFDAAFMIFGGGIPVDPGTAEAIHARLAALFERTTPWHAAIRYSNFVEGRADTRGFYSAHAYRRLTEIKARTDPDHLFLANHPIPSPADPRPVRPRA